MSGFMKSKNGVIFPLEQGMVGNPATGFTACLIDGSALPGTPAPEMAFLDLEELPLEAVTTVPAHSAAKKTTKKA